MKILKDILFFAYGVYQAALATVLVAITFKVIFSEWLFDLEKLPVAVGFILAGSLTIISILVHVKVMIERMGAMEKQMKGGEKKDVAFYLNPFPVNL